MKEIIRKIVLAVLVVVVIGAAASFVLKSDDPSVPVQTTTSAAGSVTDGQQNPDSNVIATTDSQGAVQPSQQTSDPAVQGTTGSQSAQNPQGTTNPNAPSQQTSDLAVQGTTGSQNPQGTTNPYVPSQQTSDPAVQGTTGSQNPQDTTNPNAPSQQTSQPSQYQPGSDATTTTGVYVPTYKIEKYQRIFKSGKFIMKVNDPDLGAVTMAMSGNKMFVEASMEGLTLKMLYDGDKPSEDNPENGTWYIIIDKIKKYSPMPSDMIGDMDVEDLVSNFSENDNNNVYSKGVEVINGEQLDCESCVDSNGNTTKYYFRGDVLVRSDSISPSGEVSTTEFQEISENVDDSMFTIPSGYAKWDISWLINAMG